jgi:hypothetical protein
MLDALGSRKKVRSVCSKLSKIKYYLLDNIQCLMLSQLIGRVQEESERAGDRVPTGDRERTWPLWGKKNWGQSRLSPYI